MSHQLFFFKNIANKKTLCN